MSVRRVGRRLNVGCVRGGGARTNPSSRGKRRCNGSATTDDDQRHRPSDAVGKPWTTPVIPMSSRVQAAKMRVGERTQFG